MFQTLGCFRIGQMNKRGIPYNAVWICLPGILPCPPILVILSNWQGFSQGFAANGTAINHEKFDAESHFVSQQICAIKEVPAQLFSFV